MSLTTRDCGGWEAAGSGSYCSAWVAAGYYLEIADLNSKFEHLLINHIEFFVQPVHLTLTQCMAPLGASARTWRLLKVLTFHTQLSKFYLEDCYVANLNVGGHGS